MDQCFVLPCPARLCLSYIARIIIQVKCEEVWWPGFKLQIISNSSVSSGNLSAFDVSNSNAHEIVDSDITIGKRKVAHGNTILLRPKLCHQSSVMPYSTDNHSKQRAKLEGEKHLHRDIKFFQIMAIQKTGPVGNNFLIHLCTKLTKFVFKTFKNNFQLVLKDWTAASLQWRLKLCNHFKMTRSFVFTLHILHPMQARSCPVLGIQKWDIQQRSTFWFWFLSKPSLHAAAKCFLLALLQH